MGDLIVKRSYTLGPEDILTVDKINLMATPIVELALSDPVNDQNFLRNGNFYSSFWTTPAGKSCPVNVWTGNANYWLVRPQGAAVTTLRSSTVPDQFSLFSHEIQGAVSVSTCEIAQQINGDLSATMRRKCTFSGYLYNVTGLTMSPNLKIYTCDAFNNFNTVTLRLTVNLQTVPNATWIFCTATVDLSSATTVPNVANGLLVSVELPSGSINDPSKNVLFSRLKFQIGEIATEFVDDTSLFVTAPSVDSTMLQDGCIARPSLFLPNVVPVGAYQSQSIRSGDIGVGQVKAINLDPGISTTTSAGFTVPAINSNVAITMTSVTGISAGLLLSIAGAGSYATVSLAGNVVTATNTGAAGNAAAGTVINSGAAVTTSGNAVIGGLGYTPINKAGDTAVGIIDHAVDTVVGAGSAAGSGVIIEGTEANKANDGYFPAIGFKRGTTGNTRAVGLAVDGRLKTVDQANVVGYLLDSVHQVDTASIQDKAVTLAKLADSLVSLLIPPGLIHVFAGPNIPSGWLVCDGTQYLQSQYPALYSAIGSYYGAGGSGASAWFNVPDLRGRSPIGYVNTAVGGITARTFGSLGGAETHVLTIGELPAHNHPATDSGHTHPMIDNHYHTYVNPVGGSVGLQGGAGSYYSPVGTANTTTTQGQLAVGSGTANISIQSAGSGTAHTIMQPFTVMYFIIKT